MEIFLAILIFAVGIVFIVKGGDWFVDASAWMAEVSGIPKVIVGATVVSLATTLPEIIVSLLAAFQGLPDMAFGNAIGSVTANTGIIMAISAVCLPFVIERKNYSAKGILMLSAIGTLFLFSFFSYDKILETGSLPLIGSIILLLIFAIFIYENVASAKKNAIKSERETPDKKEIWSNVIKFIFGTVGIVWGANILVDKGQFLALKLGIPEAIIGVTVIAIGTSLPELVTTITSITKKQSSLGVGNIIGANIIDTTLILPLCGLINKKPLPISKQGIYLDTPSCLVITLIAIVPMLISSKLKRWQGVTMLLMYGVYLTVMLKFFMV